MGSLARKMARNAEKRRNKFPDLSREYAEHNRYIDQVLDAQRAKVLGEQDRLAALDPALKGIKGGNCNRTACQKPHAIFYNHGTQLYYCASCAHQLNFDKFNHADAQRLYGHLLVQVGASAYEDLKVLSLTPMGQTRAVERALEMAEHLTERGEVYNA